tara:strand:+ start:4299 stop:4745 length:447 start_codon:yes stop_codon:yes gene_type:complete
MEIQDYSNYLIYSDGRVYSKKRDKFLKPQVKKGYINVNLYNDTNNKWFSIHRLVALHYIPNPKNKPQVDHIDLNTLNNDVSNLRWVTREEQMDNRSITTNTGEKYITHRKDRKNNRYIIEKKKCFRESLNCNHYDLQDAINLRDALLV